MAYKKQRGNTVSIIMSRCILMTDFYLSILTLLYFLPRMHDIATVFPRCFANASHTDKLKIARVDNWKRLVDVLGKHCVYLGKKT